MDLQLGVLEIHLWTASRSRDGSGGAWSPGLFTASERIIQDFASEKKVDATFIKDLIKKVLQVLINVH